MRWIPWNTSLIINLVAAGVTALVLLLQVPPLLGALLTPGLERQRPTARLTELLTGHEEDRVTYQSRFEGRSLFFKPPAPTPRPKQITRRDPPKPAREPDPVDTGPPPPPREYSGPSILFVLGEEVWFRNGLRLRVGEEGDGVRVISSDAPWTVRLGFRGGEYDVPLFDRAYPGLDNRPPQRQTRTPGLVRVEPETDVTENAQEEMP